MPLRYDLSGIPGFQGLCYTGENPVRINPTTEALIFSTMIVGINEINAGNAGNFFARLSAYERLIKPLMDRPMTLVDVLSHDRLRQPQSPRCGRVRGAEDGIAFDQNQSQVGFL